MNEQVWLAESFDRLWAGRDPFEAVEALRGFAAGDERVESAGGGLFFWHPDGLGRSKMAEKAQPRLIGVGTGRNWNTVRKLAAMVGLED